jgi:hypothetical protein
VLEPSVLVVLREKERFAKGTKRNESGKREKSCIYGIGYHLAIYGVRKELLEIKNSRHKKENQKRLYRLEKENNQTQTHPIKTPVPKSQH